jgi:hypothetical protein
MVQLYFRLMDKKSHVIKTDNESYWHLSQHMKNVPSHIEKGAAVIFTKKTDEYPFISNG